MEGPGTAQSPISYEEAIGEYIDQLHSRGLGSSEAEEFKRRFWSDVKFQRLALGAERLFEYRDLIFKELEELDE